MGDKKFLEWIYNRLLYQYKENPDIDYMRKLKSIIESTDPKQLTPNTK